MKNLFIVNTPFHLLTSFIISHFFKGEDDNYLALIHPHGYENWHKSPILSFMSSTAGGYKGVFPLVDFLSSRRKKTSFKAQVAEVEATLGALGIDNIFLGSDIDPQNQFLVAALGHVNFYRFEDGLYSYYNANRKRNWWKEKFHKLQMKLVMEKAGIKGKLPLNTLTASSSVAGLGDYMYKPELLKRYSPKTIKIDHDAITQSLNIIKEKGLYEKYFTEPWILYLSQPLVEKGLITLGEELEFLKAAKANFPGGLLVYKPHPNDSAGKLSFMQEHIPDLKIWPNPLPAEIILAMEDDLIGVISYESTTLMYANLFADKEILALSLSDCTGHPMFVKYKEIMEEAGVKFPKTIEELNKIWQAFKATKLNSHL